MLLANEPQQDVLVPPSRFRTDPPRTYPPAIKSATNSTVRRMLDSRLLLSVKPLHLHTLRVRYSSPYYNDFNSKISATNIGSSSFLGFIDLVSFFSPLPLFSPSFSLPGSSFGTLRRLRSVLALHLESVVLLQKEQEAVYT